MTRLIPPPCRRGQTTGDANAAGSAKTEIATNTETETGTGIGILGAAGQPLIVTVDADETPGLGVQEETESTMTGTGITGPQGGMKDGITIVTTAEQIERKTNEGAAEGTEDVTMKYPRKSPQRT